MNIYYLKRFRKLAKRMFRIRYCEPMSNAVAVFKFQNQVWVLIDGHVYNIDSCLDEAKECLAQHRRMFIRKLVSEERAKKLNKQLAKL